MQASTTNLSALLAAWLPAKSHQVLSRCGAVLEERGVPAYAVGGLVRDALLSRPFTGDADLTVLGDGIAAATLMASALGGEVLSHSQFGTASVQIDGLTIDVVTARRERYASPGALPIVEPGTLEDDLQRRDFTVNAMAVCISPKCWGTLYDPHGGQADLQAGMLRVLHPNSFSDDPTRMVRAVRYATRLRFAPHAETARMLRQDASALAALSAARRWHELERCLREQAPDLQCAALDAWGLLRHFHRELALTPTALQAFGRWRSFRYDEQLPPPTALALLCWDLGEPSVEQVIQQLGLPGAYAETLRAVRGLRSSADILAVTTEPSDILDRLPGAAALAGQYALPSPVARGAIRTYRALWKYVRPQLRGDELIKLGVERGPSVGRYLAALRSARRHEIAKTPGEERWLVRDWLARAGPPNTS